MPAAEVTVTVDLVERLVASQRPDLAQLPIEVMANGWDNFICRLGEALAVRLPRRTLAADLVRHEQRWLPVLAPRLPLPVPAPVFAGKAAFGYPWPWSIVPFLPGRPAISDPPSDLADAATRLGGFLGALHGRADPDAPANPFRGGPLADRSQTTARQIRQLGTLIDATAVSRAWGTALAVPPWGGPSVWLHADLHPGNILVDRGRVSAVIDFGDLTSGDPATDLSVAWILLPADQRDAFRRAYRAVAWPLGDDDAWARARGWALVLSLAFLAHSADNPRMAEVGRRGLGAVLE